MNDNGNGNTKIYAGLLIQQSRLRLTFVTFDETDTTHSLYSPLDPVSYKNEDFDDDMDLTKSDREGLLYGVAERISKLPDQVARIGVACYGPLLSVSIADRNEENEKYGKVSERTRHKNLKGFEVYQTLRNALDEKNINAEVIIQTDVACGAIHQAYQRISKPTSDQSFHQLSPQNILVFLHVFDGIGGSFITDMRPWPGAINSEFGYISAQVNAKDDWGLKKAPHAGGRHHPVFIEELVSVEAALARHEYLTGQKVESLSEVSEDVCEFISDAVAQLCAAVTLVLAPHQIVLHGPVIQELGRETDNAIDMIQLVRDKYLSWLNTNDGIYIDYPEMRNLDHFIDSATGVVEKNDEDQLVFEREPMLLGAAILAAQQDLSSRR